MPSSEESQESQLILGKSNTTRRCLEEKQWLRCVTMHFFCYKVIECRVETLW